MSTKVMEKPRSERLIPTPDSMYQGNPIPRLPLVFILDQSGSMAGLPIQNVMNGFKSFVTLSIGNYIARNRLDVTIILVGGSVTILLQNVPVEDLELLNLDADGDTPLGEAMLAAFDVTEQQKKYYKDNNISYIQPVVVCLTDGEPTDPELFEEAMNQLYTLEANKKVSFRVVGCNGTSLAAFSSRKLTHPPELIDNSKIVEFFEYVSEVVSKVVSDPCDANGQLIAQNNQ